MTARSISRSVAGPFARSIVGRIIRDIWTPAELFADGQNGLWVEASPTYKGNQVLWQQSDGTVIVDANGDPVGRADDLSPNANHPTQATSADRPTYNTDGTLHWLAFGALGDSLLGPDNLITGQSGWTLAMVGKGDSTFSTGWIDILGSVGGADGLIPTYEHSLRTGGGFVGFGNFLAEPHVYRLTHPGNGNIFDTRCWINGAEVARSSGTDAVLNLGATTTTQIHNNIAGDMYAFIALPYEVTAEQGAEIDKYLAKRIGLTL